MFGAHFQMFAVFVVVFVICPVDANIWLGSSFWNDRYSDYGINYPDGKITFNIGYIHYRDVSIVNIEHKTIPIHSITVGLKLTYFGHHERKI